MRQTALALFARAKSSTPWTPSSALTGAAALEICTQWCVHLFLAIILDKVLKSGNEQRCTTVRHFHSYARSTAAQPECADACSPGIQVCAMSSCRPRTYAEVIEERLGSAKAVVVICRRTPCNRNGCARKQIAAGPKASSFRSRSTAPPADAVDQIQYADLTG